MVAGGAPVNLLIRAALPTVDNAGVTCVLYIGKHPQRGATVLRGFSFLLLAVPRRQVVDIANAVVADTIVVDWTTATELIVAVRGGGGYKVVEMDSENRVVLVDQAIIGGGKFPHSEHEGKHPSSPARSPCCWTHPEPWTSSPLPPQRKKPTPRRDFVMDTDEDLDSFDEYERMLLLLIDNHPFN